MKTARLFLLSRLLNWFQPSPGPLPESEWVAKVIMLERLLIWFRAVNIEIETCKTDLWDEE